MLNLLFVIELPDFSKGFVYVVRPPDCMVYGFL